MEDAIYPGINLGLCQSQHVDPFFCFLKDAINAFFFVCREAKKDAMGRQVYRLLTSIHDSFEQISDKILAIDRARREAAEQEAKLAALSSRSIDINKLQSDLDSIRKENDFLEQQLPRDR